MSKSEFNVLNARCPAELLQRVDAAIAGIKAVNSASSMARSDFIRQAVTDLCEEVERDLADIHEMKAAEAARQPANTSGAIADVRERNLSKRPEVHLRTDCIRFCCRPKTWPGMCLIRLKSHSSSTRSRRHLRPASWLLRPRHLTSLMFSSTRW